jgi:hypothetical protein
MPEHMAIAHTATYYANAACISKHAHTYIQHLCMPQHATGAPAWCGPQQHTLTPYTSNAAGDEAEGRAAAVYRDVGSMHLFATNDVLY